MRHQLGHRLRRIFGKAHVTIGQYASEFTARLNNRDAGDRMRHHQCLRFRQGRFGCDGDGVHHHAALKALDLTHGSALFFNA